MHRIRSACVGAEHDDLQIFIDPQKAARGFHAVHAGQIDIHQQHVDLAETDGGEHLLYAACVGDHRQVTLIAEQASDAGAHECLLVCD